jgi:hypothetical protein
VYCVCARAQKGSRFVIKHSRVRYSPPVPSRQTTNPIPNLEPKHDPFVMTHYRVRYPPHVPSRQTIRVLLDGTPVRGKFARVNVSFCVFLFVSMRSRQSHSIFHTTVCVSFFVSSTGTPIILQLNKGGPPAAAATSTAAPLTLGRVGRLLR